MLEAPKQHSLMDRFSISTLFSRRWLLIVILTLVVFAAALWKNDRKTASYFGSSSITVQTMRNYPTTSQLILQSSQTQDLQGAIATTQAWVGDPFYVSQTLAGAHLSSNELSLKDFSKIFQVVSPVALSSTYQVQYVGSSPAEVSDVFASLHKVLLSAQNDYDTKHADLTISLAFTDPTVTTQSSGIPLVPIAGLVIGFVFALIIAAIYDRSVKA